MSQDAEETKRPATQETKKPAAQEAKKAEESKRALQASAVAGELLSTLDLKYEYIEVRTVAQLGEKAKDGWRFCAVFNGGMILERPVQS